MNATVTLPGGFWRDGVHYRDAALRPLTGADEAFLLEDAAGLSTARRVSAVLVRCLLRLGPLSPVNPEAVAGLTVGDREALLLHLRRLTLGETMPCVLDCPWCGGKMDLDLSVGQLLLPTYPHHRAVFETTVGDGERRYPVRFRLPTGADQAAVEALVIHDPWAAADALLQRCVLEVVAENHPLVGLPAAVTQHLPAVMERLDPQADLNLNLGCPECGRDFSTAFDTAAYLFRELAGRGRYLYWEVHQLAFCYHWGEAEILGLTGRKRRLYLDLLAETLEAGRGAA
jgi:hypothetical protein